jgi:hypothetical protein
MPRNEGKIDHCKSLNLQERRHLRKLDEHVEQRYLYSFRYSLVTNVYSPFKNAKRAKRKLKEGLSHEFHQLVLLLPRV